MIVFKLQVSFLNIVASLFHAIKYLRPSEKEKNKISFFCKVIKTLRGTLFIVLTYLVSRHSIMSRDLSLTVKSEIFNFYYEGSNPSDLKVFLLHLIYSNK